MAFRFHPSSCIYFGVNKQPALKELPGENLEVKTLSLMQHKILSTEIPLDQSLASKLCASHPIFMPYKSFSFVLATLKTDYIVHARAYITF